MALRYWKWGNVPEMTRNEFHAKGRNDRKAVPPRWWGNVPEKTRNEFHAKDATIAKGCRSVGLPCSLPFFSFFIFHSSFFIMPFPADEFHAKGRNDRKGVPLRWAALFPFFILHFSSCLSQPMSFTQRDATIAKGCRSVGLPLSPPLFSFFILHFSLCLPPSSDPSGATL
jgi:hypothetical protein